jgi:hypothetical protein
MESWRFDFAMITCMVDMGGNSATDHGVWDHLLAGGGAGEVEA